MRIIGGHDYYDGVVPFDADRTRVFLRDARKLQLPQPYSPTLHVANYTGAKWHHEIDTLEVIFCGRRYHGMRLTRTLRYGGAPTETHCFWTAPKLRGFMAETGMAFAKPKYRWHRAERGAVYDDTLDSFFDIENVPVDLLKRLINDKVLVAIAPVLRRYGRDDEPWTVNCDGLRELHFSSIVAPWEAYQELDMFLGTILVGDESKMVTVSDETKLAKYGFDQWSFKNPVHRAKPRGRAA